MYVCVSAYTDTQRFELLQARSNLAGILGLGDIWISMLRVYLVSVWPLVSGWQGFKTRLNLPRSQGFGGSGVWFMLPGSGGGYQGIPILQSVVRGTVESAG